VLVVQKAGFVELPRRQPELSLCILSATAQHTNDLMNLVADLTLLDVQTRLAKWLVANCQQHGAHPDGQGRCCVQLSMTKRVLVAELGTGSETLSRSLAKLSQQGLVVLHGHRIILLSLTKLACLAGHDRAHLPGASAAYGAGGRARVAALLLRRTGAAVDQPSES